MTANSTIKLPKLAAITILHLEIKTVARNPPMRLDPKITIATPKLAPELIPRTKGPANGFLNKVCIRSPDIPKPEPARTAGERFWKPVVLDNVVFLMSNNS